MKYNYDEAIKKDIRQWIEDDGEYRFCLADYKHTYDHFRDTAARVICDALYDLLWDCDRVTGYMTGYDMPEECEKYLDGNWELAKRAVETQDSEEAWQRYMDEKDYVGIDTNVRLYLLYGCLIDIVNTELFPILEKMVVEDDE